MPRITPAYAGKTRTWKTVGGEPQDHPRIRGKDQLFNFFAGLVIGSPPHTRERQIKRSHKTSAFHIENFKKTSLSLKAHK